MSPESPGPAPAADPAGRPADGSAGTRGSVFALPARTSFRFALLIAAVVISSVMVYGAIYGATPRGAALAALIRVCQARALAPHPNGLSAVARALGQARGCRAGAERVDGLWVLLGIGVLGVLSGAIYWVQPWWYRRRMHLTPLTGDESPALADRLEQLRERAGTGPVTWLLQPLNFQLSAFAFGRFRRRFVAVSGGAVVAQSRQPAAFDAVVLHELGHIRNRDIDQTYLAMAVWWAFIVAALLPMAGLLIFSRQLGSPPGLLWRVVVLALIVYLLRNSILRAREFDADARVAELDPDTSLGAVLAGLPARRGWRVLHMGWVHPSGQDRAAALLDPAPLYRCGFWDGLAVGVVAAMGAEAGQELVYLLLTASAIGGLVPAFIFALFSGAALTVAMWRMQFLEGGTLTARRWAVGLGLGIGVAIGPVITLETVYDQGVAPDSLHTGAFIVLAIWVVLVTFIFMSVPAWIGRWADAWQQRERRVPARGGMIVAAVGTWVVLAIGIDLVLAWFTSVEEYAPDAKTVLDDKSFLEQNWTFSGYYAARTVGAWVVCLVFIAVPLAGYIAGHRRPASGLRDTARKPRVWLERCRPLILICLAGVVTVIAVTLVTAAVARAHIAPAIRWNGVYFTNFLLFEEQMVILVAVIVALIAAATLTYALSDTIAIAVAAIVAALGILVMMGSLTLGNCVAPFNLTYNHPPASDCTGDPGFMAPHIFPAAIEAALIGILLIPAAHYTGILVARRSGLTGRPGLSARALRWLAAGAVAVAVTAGIALRVPDASAHRAQPIGSIGQDGWVNGTGYEIRLFPNWYQITRPGYTLLVNDGTFSGIPGDLVISTEAISPKTIVRVRGARLVLLDGERALYSVFPNYKGYYTVQWITIRNGIEYFITFNTRPIDYTTLAPNLTAMINSWHWNATSS